MAGKGRWIALYESFTEWEWYDHIPTKIVYLHLLLTAKWKATTEKGVKLERGQRIITIRGLAQECGLTVQQTRNTLNNLQKTQNITQTTFPRYSIITVIGYDKYQKSNTNATQKPTQTQTQKPTHIPYNTNIQYTNIQDIYIGDDDCANAPRAPAKPKQTKFIPPTLEQVQAYCTEIEKPIDVDKFIDYFKSVGWIVGKGKPMKDWKAAVRNWRKRDEQNGTVYHPKQASYDMSEVEKRTAAKYQKL